MVHFLKTDQNICIDCGLYEFLLEINYVQGIHSTPITMPKNFCAWKLTQNFRHLQEVIETFLSSWEIKIERTRVGEKYGI